MNMNRLGAFIAVCVAAILFILVAYTKLSNDGFFTSLQPGRPDGLLRPPKRDSSFHASSRNQSLEDIRKFGLNAEKFIFEDQNPGKTHAEIADSQSSSDLSSSENEDSSLFSNQTVEGVVTQSSKADRRVNESGHNDGKPIVIIVLARMRTGSSLVGEMLNQNPTLFYIFEPLHAIDHVIHKHRAMEVHRNKLSVELLRSISKCQFSQEFVNSISSWGLGKFKSSGLRPICRATNGCKAVAHTMVEDRCRLYGGRVGMKTIRADLAMVRPLLETDHYNVKIIHLLRDPRGTANSRKGYYSDRSKHDPRNKNTGHTLSGAESTLKALGLLEENPPVRMNTIVKYCRWMVETVSMAKSKAAWLKDRYLFLRYEDLALDPIGMLQKVYNFLGMTIPNNVGDWVANNTKESNSKGNGSRFGMQKNSRQVMQSWRHSLSFNEVKGVQEICGKAMDLGRYKKILTPEQLEDADFETFEPV